MDPEALSFIRLSEVVTAKIERRLSLLAEVASIEAELKAAHVLLGTIPSLGGEQAEPTKSLEPGPKLAFTARVRRKRTFQGVCRCGQAVEYEAVQRSTTRLCADCLQAKQVARGKALGASRRRQ